MTTHEEFTEPVRPTKEQQAAKLRAEMPNAYALVDEVRSVFGDGIAVTMLQEGSRQVKTNAYVTDEETRYLNAGQYLRLGELIERDEAATAEQVKGKRNGR